MEHTEERLELEPTPPEVKRYQRQKSVANFVSAILSLAALAFMAFLGGPYLDRLIWHWPAVANILWVRLAILGFCYAAGLELLSLPLHFWSGFILEHRYHLSNQTFRGWIWQRIKMYLVGGPLGLVFLIVLYSFLWYGGSFWWLRAAAAWTVVSFLLGRLLTPIVLPLFYKVTRIDDDSLLGRFQRISEGTGLKVNEVYRLDLSAETKKANAALTLWSRRPRVLLGDTLLQSFSPEEIEVIFAHEVGHHVHKHLLKGWLLQACSAVAALLVTDVLVRILTGALNYPTQGVVWPGGYPISNAYQDPAALPIFLLVLTVFGLIGAPLWNALSRHWERQCDRYALQRTRMPDAYRSAFIKLARLNKADADRHPVLVWLLDDHPPIRQRLAMADEWQGGDRVTR